MKCKTCGHEHADHLKNCPHCGAAGGNSRSPYVSCPRCATVMPARRKECPGCGLPITPENALPAPTPVRQPDRRRKTGRRQIIRWSIFVLLLAGVLAGEGFLVAGIYHRQAYRHTMELWNCGDSVEANRRSPDPVYKETTIPEVPDSLFDDFLYDPAAADTIFTEGDPMESAPTGTDDALPTEEAEALFD